MDQETTNILVSIAAIFVMAAIAFAVGIVVGIICVGAFGRGTRARQWDATKDYDRRAPRPTPSIVRNDVAAPPTPPAVVDADDEEMWDDINRLQAYQDQLSRGGIEVEGDILEQHRKVAERLAQLEERGQRIVEKGAAA